MPLTLTLSEGALTQEKAKAAFERLCNSMLKWHGLSGNTVMTPNVVGCIHTVPESMTYSGSQEAKVAFIEWKVPSFAFNTREIQKGFIEEATNIVHDMSDGTLPKNRIWVNVIHAVDGAWGIGGQAMTNSQLGEAISQG